MQAVQIRPSRYGTRHRGRRRKTGISLAPIKDCENVHTGNRKDTCYNFYPCHRNASDSKGNTASLWTKCQRLCEMLDACDRLLVGPLQARHHRRSTEETDSAIRGHHTCCASSDPRTKSVTRKADEVFLAIHHKETKSDTFQQLINTGKINTVDTVSDRSNEGEAFFTNDSKDGKYKRRVAVAISEKNQCPDREITQKRKRRGKIALPASGLVRGNWLADVKRLSTRRRRSEKQENRWREGPYEKTPKKRD